jgi:hypothetical protein
LQPYAIALAGMALLAGAMVAAQKTLGVPVPLPLGVLLLFGFCVVFLGSAWLGYGPGIVVCLLVTVLPRLIVTRTPRNRFDAIRFGLLLAVSLLVSYIGSIHRRREGDLRRQAEELERRVRERSD